MKINPHDSQTQLPEVREAYIRQTAGKGGPKGTSVPQGDQVNISSGAKEAHRMLLEIDRAPDVREDKVREIQAAINAGVYNVSGESVTEKLIKETMLGTIL